MSALTLIRRRWPAARAGSGPLADAPSGDAAGAPAQRSDPGPDGRLYDVDSGLSPWARYRRKIVIVAIIAYFLLLPAGQQIVSAVTPRSVVLAAGSLAFVVVVTWVAVAPANPGQLRIPWARLVLIVGSAIALLIIGGAAWITILAVAAAACGRFSATIRPAIFGTAACIGAAFYMGVSHHYDDGTMASILVLPPMSAFFAYMAGKRNEMVAMLSQTRAELARVAVSEERLRIARDLHDLLGHSLSLITLKAELSRRVISTDTERAAREIAELEAVARQSLIDVREAVAGYRQPDLAAELGAARQLLIADGVACQISAPDILELPGEVDAALAWTVREGITNVVRHAGATRVSITVSSSQEFAIAEIVDDGPGCDATAADGPAQPGDGTTAVDGASAMTHRTAGANPARLADGQSPAPVFTRLRLAGSGLAGLAERVRHLGGDLAAGPLEPRGFRLRVTIPLASAVPPSRREA